MQFQIASFVATILAFTPLIAAAPAVSPNESELARRANAGDLTYYDVGLGACGWTNADSEMVVALSWELMGTQSNGNPNCGKKIKVSYGGKSVVVKVVDKCMGCKTDDLDLSPAAFSALAPESAGRIKGTWVWA
ncbi:SCP-like extracellular protein [Rutstroemia sp. NJR-2017a BVV2]|nr:SCP-like extracellular protein [Rutstroemia sp. NJR-2017a BVV2]